MSFRISSWKEFLSIGMDCAGSGGETTGHGACQLGYGQVDKVVIDPILNLGTGAGQWCFWARSSSPESLLETRSWRDKKVEMASNQQRAGLDVRMKFFTIRSGRHWHKCIRESVDSL